MAKERQWELVRNAGPHRHRHEDGSDVVYEPGEVVHDSRDLGTLWPGKFNELGKPQAEKKKQSKLKAAVAARHNPAQEAVDLEDGDEDDTTLVESEFGKDVTADYPYAAKSDLKVFLDPNEKKFTVCDADDTTKALNQTDLTKGKNVIKWVREYRKGNHAVKPTKKGKKKDEE